MAATTDKKTPASDASDEDINTWWMAMRGSGMTDRDIQRSLISIMMESYKEILLKLDEAQWAEYQADTSWISPFGPYRPMFPETAHGSDGSGYMKLDSLKARLEHEARSDVSNPSERLRALHRAYQSHISGDAERVEAIVGGIMGEWLPLAGMRGQRTGPSTGEGRTPGPSGTEETAPRMRVNLLKQKTAQTKTKPVPAATPAPLPNVDKRITYGPRDGNKPHFHGHVSSDNNGQVTFKVESQVTRIKGVADPGAATARKEALVFAAREASQRGQPTFKMKVDQANLPFEDNPGSLQTSRALVQKVGIPATEKISSSGNPNAPNYEATLDTAKVLSKYGP